MASVDGMQAWLICVGSSDQVVYNKIMNIWYFQNKTNARKYLEHYRYGGGTEFLVDVSSLFSANPRIAARISRLINMDIIKRGVMTTSGVFSGKNDEDGKRSPIRQDDYDSEDWDFSLGNVDIVRWSLTGPYNPTRYNYINITVEDPYEWHPLEDRPTKCIHEHMENLKKDGAADYLAKGSGIIYLPPPIQLPDLPLEIEF